MHVGWETGKEMKSIVNRDRHAAGMSHSHGVICLLSGGSRRMECLDLFPSSPSTRDAAVLDEAICLSRRGWESCVQ